MCFDHPHAFHLVTCRHHCHCFCNVLALHTQHSAWRTLHKGSAAAAAVGVLLSPRSKLGKVSSTEPSNSKSTSMGMPGPRSSAAASVNTSVNTWYLRTRCLSVLQPVSHAATAGALQALVTAWRAPLCKGHFDERLQCSQCLHLRTRLLNRGIVLLCVLQRSTARLCHLISLRIATAAVLDGILLVPVCPQKVNNRSTVNQTKNNTIVHRCAQAATFFRVALFPLHALEQQGMLQRNQVQHQVPPLALHPHALPRAGSHQHPLQPETRQHAAHTGIACCTECRVLHRPGAVCSQLKHATALHRHNPAIVNHGRYIQVLQHAMHAARVRNNGRIRCVQLQCGDAQQPGSLEEMQCASRGVGREGGTQKPSAGFASEQVAAFAKDLQRWLLGQGVGSQVMQQAQRLQGIMSTNVAI